MVNSTKNNKVKKRKVSKNSKHKPSSAQKENKPKNGKDNNCKVTKADLKDAIAMSKQLAMKRNNNQTKRQTSSKNANRVCGNGRPLPSLAELEKYFEDSDGEENTAKANRPESCNTPTPTEQTEEVKVEDKLLSPKTINKISERMLNMISEISDPTELLNITPPVVPPKKRKKTEIPYIVGCIERPKITSKPNANFCKGDEDYGVELNNEVDDSPPPKRAKKSKIRPYSKSIFNAKSDEIAERLTNVDANYESSDSDKTIEYMPSTGQSQRPPSFSPLPSTSQDRETFIKNDELFNQCLRDKVVSKESTPEEKKEDKPGLDIPETIVIDDIVDEPRTYHPSVIKYSYNDVEIIEPENTDSLVNTPIQNSVNNRQNNSDHSMIDCDEYNDIHVEKDNYKIDTIEIIDVDDVIAENQSIIDKWKSNGSNDISKFNAVVDVPNTSHNNTPQPTPSTPEVPISYTVPIPVRMHHNPDHRLVTPMGSIGERSPVFYTERDTVQPSTSRTAFTYTRHKKSISIEEVVTKFFQNKNIRDLLNKQKKHPVPKKFRVTSMIKDLFNRFISRAVPTPDSNIMSQPMPTANTRTMPILGPTANTLPRSTNMPTGNTRTTPTLVPTGNTVPRPTNMTTGNTRTMPTLVPTTNTLPRPTNMPTGNTSTMPILVPTANRPRPTNMRTRDTRTMPILVPTGNTPPRLTNMPTCNTRTMPILVPTANTVPRPTNMPTGNARTTPTLVPTGNTPPRPTNMPTGNARTTPTLVATGNTPPRPTNMPTGSAHTTPILVPTGNTPPSPTRRARLPKCNTENQVNPNNSSISNVSVSSDHDRNIGECPICMDPLSPVNGMASTICGHVFCLKCIRVAVIANGKKCPTCRKEFKSSGTGYHQLFL